MAKLFKRRRSRRTCAATAGRGFARWLLDAAPRPRRLFVAGAAVTAVAGLHRLSRLRLDLPPVEEVLSQNAGGAKIYDRNGDLLYEYVDDLQGLRQPVPSVRGVALPHRRHHRHRGRQFLLQPRRQRQGAHARRL